MTNRTTAARPFPWLLVLGGLVTVVLITVVILTFDSGGESGGQQFGEPTITGSALPRFDDSAADPAAGMPAPTVVGADFDGEPVSITTDGRPKIIIFLAHWCSVCQAEVPVVQDWLGAGLKPDEVDMYSVATGVAETRPNYPPSEWLASEGWTAPVLLDDTAYSVADAFGLNAYPFWVFVNADGTVAGRLTGGLPPEAITQIAASLLEG